MLVRSAEDHHSRSHMIRQACREAWMCCEDSRVLRCAIDARPRPDRDFCLGDSVCYWRKGRGAVQGGMPAKTHGRWYGKATVVGLDRGNLWVSQSGRARGRAEGKAGNGFGLTLDRASRRLARGESAPPQSPDGST